MQKAAFIQHINIKLLKQKTWAILDQVRETNPKLKTGRRIGLGHYLCIQQLIELFYIDYKNHQLHELVTNRGNLAHAFKCSPRSVYNYLVDFESLGFITSYTEKTALNYIMCIKLKKDILSTDTCGKHKSDSPNIPHVPGVGKLCRIHTNKLVKNNNINNNGSSFVENYSSETREAANYALDASISQGIHEKKELQNQCNNLWRLAKANLYPGKSFRAEVERETVQLIALTLINQAAQYDQDRKRLIKDFCMSPAYQTSADKKQVKMLRRFRSSLSDDLKNPYRTAFKDITRAIIIQSENATKKGYKVYHPTVLFSQYFHKAMEFAMREKRTLSKYDKINKKRRAHAVCKNKLTVYADRAVRNLHKYGFVFAKNQLRVDYKNFYNFLVDTPLSIENKKKYMERFLNQTAFAIQKK